MLQNRTELTGHNAVREARAEQGGGRRERATVLCRAQRDCFQLRGPGNSSAEGDFRIGLAGCKGGMRDSDQMLGRRGQSHCGGGNQVSRSVGARTGREPGVVGVGQKAG